MPSFYFDPSRETIPNSLPDLPGCMPDSAPFGPFDTEDEAIADAQDY